MPHKEEDRHADPFEFLDLFHSFASVFDFFLQFSAIGIENKCKDRGRVQCRQELRWKILPRNLQKDSHCRGEVQSLLILRQNH